MDGIRAEHRISKNGKPYILSRARVRRRLMVRAFGVIRRQRSSAPRPPLRKGHHRWLSIVVQLRIRKAAARGQSQPRLARAYGVTDRTIRRVLSDERAISLIRRMLWDGGLWTCLPEVLATIRNPATVAHVLPHVVLRLTADDSTVSVHVRRRALHALRRWHARSSDNLPQWAPEWAPEPVPQPPAAA
jgi:hypothetical protein